MIETQKVQYVSLNRIVPGNNPRSYFDEAEMKDLENSVAEHGIIQPILLRPLEDGSNKFQIIAGERRFRAAMKVFGEVYQMPALCRKATQAEADQMALIENIQRANMSPTEEAEAAAKILGQCNGDREETARLLAWTISKLDKRLALMNCSASVRDALTKRQIFLGHAELLASAPKEKQDRVVKKLLEAPTLVSVAEFKAGLEARSKELASAIFPTGECSSCKHASANQQEMFAEAISSGRCTNGACFDQKTSAVLDGLKAKLEEEYPSVRIVNAGENNTLVILKSDGVDGVGVDQAKACRACANFGAAISNVPGKIGNVRRDICFDVACNTQKVAANIKAMKAAATTAVASTSMATTEVPSSANVSKTTAATTAKVQDSQRVVEYRIKVWRAAIKKELVVDIGKNLSMLIGILMTMGGSNISSTKLAAGFAKLSGSEIEHGDVKKAATAMEAASDDIRQKMLSGIVLSILESIESRHLNGIMEFLHVDLKKYWKLNAEYLNLLTKSEIEVMAEELGLKAAMGEKYAKAANGKKDEFIKSLLNIDGFDYTGKVAKVLQYQ
ncbi:MAG: PRTRC system ParB family protein [Burkholderiales bacterium]